MTSLLSIASKIEAAMATYISVRDVTDRAEWRCHFDEEKAKTTKVFWQIRKDNSEEAPALHPTLAVLSIVLASDGDLAEITRNHPHLHKHVYYQPGAEFPQDISNLLPNEDCWWETLAAKSQNAASPPAAITHTMLPRVILLLPEPPADNVVVAVNKSQESARTTCSRKKSRKATDAAADSRKCERALPPGSKTQKCHTGPSRLDDQPAREDEYKSEEGQEQDDGGNYDEEEDEIEDKEEDELEDKEEDEIDNEDNDNEEIKERKRYKFKKTVQPMHPRQGGLPAKANWALHSLQSKKAGVQPDAQEHKADWQKLTAKQVFKFHLDQVKGKKLMCGPPGEGSDSIALALTMVGNMTLDSGSSHGHSRSAASPSPSVAESPVPPSVKLSPVLHLAAAPRPSTPPAEPSVPAAAATHLTPTPSIRVADSSPAIAPSLRQHLVPKKPLRHSASSQEQSSATQASQALSPGGSGTEALERRVAVIEEWIHVQDKNWKGGL
ncbi:hypothetical protein EDB85DRAFT_2158990 [Lactarius pseudohatsudake]|nr:hypothetical protein EDB85DRAFT_2158990 [Lactarius pseudohatsudake]